MRIRKETYRAGIDWLHCLLVAHPRAEFGVIRYGKDARGYFADTDNIVNVRGAEVIGGALVTHTDGAGTATTTDLLRLLDEKNLAIVKVADGERPPQIVFDIDCIGGRIVFAIMEERLWK